MLDIYEQRSSILDKYMLAMMYMCAVQSLLIITVSEYSRGQIVKLMPMCAGKVYVLSPFVREHRLARQPASHIDRLLMVAKLDPRKNHVLVLHALAELFALRRCARPIEVHFVGEIGYRSFGKELVEIGERLSTATQRIIFHDVVSDDALNQLYAECDLLLFPSFDEGFGLPVLEALETGLAVLAAARGGVPEVAGPFASYCSIDSPAALATEINRALDSKDRMNQMASEGRADVMLRFSRDRSVAQLRNILFASRDRMGAINESR
jgi:glycosyltransferase involved in cell wall biosynthesis